MTLVAICTWMSAFSAASAHPFHISTAEVEFNPETGRFEVALKLHASDLENALQRIDGKRRDLEQDDWQMIAVDYLSQHFFFAKKLANASRPSDDSAVDKERVPTRIVRLQDDDERPKIHWVGHEFSVSWIWLYYELEPPQKSKELDRENLVLVNTVLMDVVKDQINTVSVRHAGRRTALKMTMRQRWGDFSRDWMQSSDDLKRPVN